MTLCGLSYLFIKVGENCLFFLKKKKKAKQIMFLTVLQCKLGLLMNEASEAPLLVLCSTRKLLTGSQEASLAFYTEQDRCLLVTGFGKMQKDFSM